MFAVFSVTSARNLLCTALSAILQYEASFTFALSVDMEAMYNTCWTGSEVSPSAHLAVVAAVLQKENCLLDCTAGHNAHRFIRFWTETCAVIIEQTMMAAENKAHILVPT